MSLAREVHDALDRVHQRFHFDDRSWAHAKLSMDIFIRELDIAIVIAIATAIAITITVLQIPSVMMMIQ